MDSALFVNQLSHHFTLISVVLILARNCFQYNDTKTAMKFPQSGEILIIFNSETRNKKNCYESKVTVLVLCVRAMMHAECLDGTTDCRFNITGVILSSMSSLYTDKRFAASHLPDHQCTAVGNILECRLQCLQMSNICIKLKYYPVKL